MRRHHGAIGSAMLAAGLLAACTEPDVAETWLGADADALIMAWGGPDRDYPMPDGGRELSYRHRHLEHGTTYHCTAKFYTAPDGVVVRYRLDGNVGGCDWLEGGKPARR